MGRSDIRRRSRSRDQRRSKSPARRRSRSRSMERQRRRQRSPEQSDRRDRKRSSSPRRRQRRSPEQSDRREHKRSQSPRRRRNWNYECKKESGSPEQPRRRDDDTRNMQKEDVKPKARNFDPFSGKEKEEGSSSKPDEKVSLPSFEPSGKLAADTNTFRGVVIKYNEPPEAAKPRLRWRLYPMKDDEVMQPFYIHRQSAYLIGRDRKIADFPVDHPSCSKQHAVLQYRSVPFERNGQQGRRTLPYIIDLGSANGTYLNSERIEPQRYYELKEQDILKFGYSQREYAVLHELSAEGKGGEELDVDMDEEDEVEFEGEGDATTTCEYTEF